VREAKTSTQGFRRALPLPNDEERRRAAEQFYRENKDAIDYSNEYVEKHGLWSDGLRMF
jgi:post-segregation antitoxin (ccd killing protein)